MDRLRRFAVVITVGVICLNVTSLANSEAPRSAPVRLKVAATIFPLYDLLRQVASPDDHVVLLVPPGASPHTFTARPRAIRALADSTAVFAIGHGLDNWAIRLAQNVGVKRTVVVDKQVILRAWSETHQHEHAAEQEKSQTTSDPHYWLAIPNAVRMVHHIAETLGELNPAGQVSYRHRAKGYQRQLQALHRNIRHQLSGFTRRDIATFHPAFAYFAAAYDLHIVATFEASPGREPAPRQVERFLHLIEAQNLRVLFVEPQLPQGPLSTLARDLGVTLSVLDPLGGAEKRDSYIAMMRFNASQMAAALRE
jgi:ABC-type Zn uptake system ZnuABC Zn-binding protein ZnuA